MNEQKPIDDSGPATMREMHQAMPELLDAYDNQEATKRELISVLRSLLSLANAYCANKTADYAEQRLKELEQ